MGLQQVAGCDDGYSCPKVFIDEERGVAVIQGTHSSRRLYDQLQPGTAEGLVEIPLAMWRRDDT